MQEILIKEVGEKIVCVGRCRSDLYKMFDVQLQAQEVISVFTWIWLFIYFLKKTIRSHRVIKLISQVSR